MSITVRSADIERDRSLIIDALSRYLTDQSTEERYDWLYAETPHGRPKAWLAFDDATDTVVGAAAAFPRRFYWGDTEAIGWVFGDFCLAPRYRSLGPALRLQRACLGVLESNNTAFCYDFPSTSMVAVYRRLKLTTTTKMIRMAKPLRMDRKVRQLVKTPAAQSIVAAVGNAFLRIASPRVTRDKSLEIARYDRACGEEFSALASELRGSSGVCVVRSAEYLVWRYFHNPLARYEFITVRRAGRLRGFAVWVQAGEDASLADLFGENNPTIVKGLLAEVADISRTRGVMTLSLWLNESHPWRSWFSQAGFRVRDSAPIMIIPSQKFADATDWESQRWFLMQADRDS